MTTYLSYFEDTYKFNEHAVIIASRKDEKGNFIVLNQTIFYPQGGGQPSDQGIIEVGDSVIPIHSVRSIDHEVRHYTDRDYSSFVGQNAKCSLNQETRLLHAKLHTAGHLLSNIIESLYPHWSAVKGHHFPDQCYVEFMSKNDSIDEIPLEFINKQIEQCIEKNCLTSVALVSGDKLKELCPNITYSIPSGQPIRIVRIGDFSFSPCGGTHVKSLKELKGMKITKYKIKKDVIKINYGI
jgi:Ser-tRNA(Ala) deacylase AlaX